MRWIRQHKGLSILVGSAGIAVLVFVLVWFEPHTIFIDQVVDDTLPTASASTDSATSNPDPSPDDPGDDASTSGPATSGPAPGETPPTFPLTIASGQFIDLAHSGSGSASIIEMQDGSRILRFENLDVDNGPDLRVILTPTPLVDDESAYDDGDFVDLGDLKGNKGNQNYVIPDDIDIDDYATVAIWCRRFNVTFNAAPLDP